MKEYIGTKLINARPMNRQQYNDFRGWELPTDESGADEGYLVEYMNGGKPNHPAHQGYISWSPKEQLDNAYRPTDGLTFGLALEALKRGKKVARDGWNGKGQYLYLVKAAALANGLDFWLNSDGSKPEFTPVIAIKTTANQVQVGWLASQTDMLSDDWLILE